MIRIRSRKYVWIWTQWKRPSFTSTVGYPAKPFQSFFFFSKYLFFHSQFLNSSTRSLSSSWCSRKRSRGSWRSSRGTYERKMKRLTGRYSLSLPLSLVELDFIGTPSFDSCRRHSLWLSSCVFGGKEERVPFQNVHSPFERLHRLFSFLQIILLCWYLIFMWYFENN